MYNVQGYKLLSKWWDSIIYRIFNLSWNPFIKLNVRLHSLKNQAWSYLSCYGIDRSLQGYMMLNESCWSCCEWEFNMYLIGKLYVSVQEVHMSQSRASLCLQMDGLAPLDARASADTVMTVNLIILLYFIHLTRKWKYTATSLLDCNLFYHDVGEIFWPQPIRSLKLGHVTGQGSKSPTWVGQVSDPGKNDFHKKCKNLDNIAVYLIESLKSKWKNKQIKNMNSWIR